MTNIDSSVTPPGFDVIGHSDGVRILASLATNPSQPEHWKWLVGSKPVLSEPVRQRLLAEISLPSFNWTTARHANFPTTDVPVYALPWLDEVMEDKLHDVIMPGIATLFAVDERKLLMRDMFLVKYSFEAGQRSLGMHWDESCFSFVLQLNSLASFKGGGTLFEHADGAPLSVEPGEVLMFCGYTPHSGVEITGGERYILTGFVDYRSDFDSIRKFDNGKIPYEHWSNFPNPSLRYNVGYLAERYGARGETLLHRIAYSPGQVPHLECGPLAECCRAWLEKGEVSPNARLSRFIEVVLQHDAEEAGERRETQEVF